MTVHVDSVIGPIFHQFVSLQGVVMPAVVSYFESALSSVLPVVGPLLLDRYNHSHSYNCFCCYYVLVVIVVVVATIFIVIAIVVQHINN